MTSITLALPSISHAVSSDSFLKFTHTIIIFSGFRETGFLYSISSAGLAVAMVKACRSGRLTTCPCRIDSKTQTWTGCDEELRYALNFARKFLKSEIKEDSQEQDIKKMTNLHNVNLGLKVPLASSCPVFEVCRNRPV